MVMKEEKQIAQQLIMMFKYTALRLEKHMRKYLDFMKTKIHGSCEALMMFGIVSLMMDIMIISNV